MEVAAFEAVLERMAAELTVAARRNPFTSASDFENATRTWINNQGGIGGVKADVNPHPHLFPDICLGKFGIELKFSEKDTWRSVANSVFEGTRDQNVVHTYVLFGKMGGRAQVRWAKYEDAVMHVRTSHVPRFELEIGTQRPLFQQFGVSYDAFQKLDIHKRMDLIRKYARGRLRPGERLWWLEDPNADDAERGVPLQPRLYMNLEQSEKRQYRAEAALLCPQIVMPSRSKRKYDDAVSYLLTYRNVLCSQARDLFSAGSVALRGSQERGGNYTLRALTDIQDEMRLAAAELEPALFDEYWGRNYPTDQRLAQWLRRADKLARDWRPSDHLFLEKQGEL